MQSKTAAEKYNAEEQQRQRQEKAIQMAHRRLLREGVCYPTYDSKKTNVENHDAILRYGEGLSTYYLRALKALEAETSERQFNPIQERKPYKDD